MLAAAATDIDAAILRNTEHPGSGGRLAAIEQVRLAPDRLHDVLGNIGGGEWRKPEPDQLGVHPRPEMIEQRGERCVVPVGADCCEKIIELMGPRQRKFLLP